MEELIQAASSTALDAPLARARPNQLFQGILAFLAVVGIGAALTVVLRPPVRLRVITVEKQLPPMIPATERMRPAPEKPAAVVIAPQGRTRRPPVTPPAKVLPRVMPTSRECNDPLCGLDLKE
jgi:hypothetical protein